MKTLLLLVITVVLIWLIVQYPHAMINPGELSANHQDLNEKCNSCHKPFWGISNDNCISCHKLSEIGKDSLNLNDPNSGSKKILFHDKLSDQKCASCHSEHNGLKPESPLSNFNHALLSGQLISNCNSCHDRPADNLHKQLSSTCSNCHNTEGWKSSVKFDHNMLQGADKNNCASCHQKPNDLYHQTFNDNCNKCHTTNKWVPSSFDHSAFFLLDRDHNAKCNLCHTDNNFSTYTCYGCHEHSQSNIMNEHDEVNTGNINDCVSCHKSGNKGDAERNGNSENESEQNGNNNEKDYNKSGEKNRGNKQDGKKEDDDD